VVENWTYSCFFLVAELWGAVVISVLFWTLANEVCTVKEAKTIYPLMGIAANVALVAAGNFMKLVNRGLDVRPLLSVQLLTPCMPDCCLTQHTQESRIHLKRSLPLQLHGLRNARFR
jgi:ATP/ADP translocase